MKGFKKGDRVIVNGSYGLKSFNDEMGTVLCYKKDSPLIEFDTYIGGHDGGGIGRYGHCWICALDIYDVELAEATVGHIDIWREGNKTIAIDETEEKRVEARCHPDDEYNFHTGARIAFERLMGNIEYPEKCIGVDMSDSESKTVYADDPSLFKEYTADELFDNEAPEYPNKNVIHANVCDEIHELYKAKNADYGDSFAQTRKKYHNAIMIRLHDKFSRLEQLYADGYSAKVNESIEDTLMDLAGYCILELTEMEFDSLTK